MREKVLTFSTNRPNTRLHVTVSDKRVATAAPVTLVTNATGEATTTVTRRGPGEAVLRVWETTGDGVRGRRLMTRVAVTG